MKMIVGLILLGVLFGACSFFPAKKKNWSDFRTPTSDAAEALGSPSAGCLKGAIRLESKLDEYILMRPSRERYWAHPELKAFIERLSHKLKKELGVWLLVGDASQPRGGRLIGGHLSHQSGLDVDLWYDLFSKLPNEFSLEDYSAHSFVKEPFLWTKLHDQYIALVASDVSVERVLIHPQIKKNLCERHKGANWLKVLRPWWGHDDHLHVRLKCPTANKLCVAGPLIPEGDGCGNELTWWFRDEAKVSPTSTNAVELKDNTPSFCEPLRDKE